MQELLERANITLLPSPLIAAGLQYFHPDIKISRWVPVPNGSTSTSVVIADRTFALRLAFSLLCHPARQ